MVESKSGQSQLDPEFCSLGLGLKSCSRVQLCTWPLHSGLPWPHTLELPATKLLDTCGIKKCILKFTSQDTPLPAVVCMEKNKQLSTSAGLFVSYRSLSLPLLSTQLCNKWKYRRWNATLTLPHTYGETHTHTQI